MDAFPTLFLAEIIEILGFPKAIHPSIKALLRIQNQDFGS